MSKKIIVHLTYSFGCGGLERVIANMISNNKNTNIEHVVVSLTDNLSFSYALPSGTMVFSLDKKDGLDLHTHYRLWKLLKKLKPTVLHTYNFATLEYHFIAKCLQVKKLIHADHGFGGGENDGRQLKHNVFRKITSLIIDSYVVVSDDLAQWVTSRARISKNKVHIVHNGVVVPSQCPPIKQKDPLQLRIVIVGRLVPVKNHKRLLLALSRIHAYIPKANIQCDIVGDGPLRAELELLTESLLQSVDVIFHGHQNDVSTFIDNADVLVLSSDYEAMPMTVLEAMAAGTAVICPDVGGVKDFVDNSVVELIPGHNPTTLADKIIELYNSSSSDYAEKILAAHNKAKDLYSVESMTAKYYKLYDI
jgi:sugar transferase (PEP-CTERM/EpsH1 system associated)